MYLLFLPDFSEKWIFSTGFRKNTQKQNFMKIRPAEAELFPFGQAIRDEAKSRFSRRSANEPN